MYNNFTNRRFMPFLVLYFFARQRFGILFVWLVAVACGNEATAQMLELHGIQPDYPMLRGGQPLKIDGEIVRIAGAEFTFQISPEKSDTLLRRTKDGRTFLATGECIPTLSGWTCTFIDTAGNPLNYSIVQASDTGMPPVWRCIGRHSEPEFTIERQP